MNRLHKVKITRRFVIDAGHRVYGYEGKCASLHGHRYEFFVSCSSVELDDLGRVVDLSVIKERVGAWLNDNWDHAMILWDEDPALDQWRDGLHTKGSPPFAGQKFFALSENPTIENLCSYLLTLAKALLRDTEISVDRIKGFETENCSACVTG